MAYKLNINIVDYFHLTSSCATKSERTSALEAQDLVPSEEVAITYLGERKFSFPLLQDGNEMPASLRWEES